MEVLSPLSSPQGRALVGFVLATLVSGAAWRLGALRRSGVATAVICGTLCATAGWAWAVVLVLYFVAAMLLSHADRWNKEVRTGGVITKGGARDGWQVAANGGLYSLGCALALLFSAPWIAWGALGALAAASADTWATEIGVWLGGEPRAILTRTPVRPGESGGVTLAGNLGSLAGALWVAILATAAGLPRGLGLAAVIAGAVGSLADSLLGATIQERRWCDKCGEPTERPVHLCGCATRRVGGIAWVGNDVINLLSTFVGFLLGVIVYSIWNRVGLRGGFAE